MQKAVDEKNEVEADPAACQERLQLAERLVGGLADENERWGVGVAELRKKQHTLISSTPKVLDAALAQFEGAASTPDARRLVLVLVVAVRVRDGGRPPTPLRFFF